MQTTLKIRKLQFIHGFVLQDEKQQQQNDIDRAVHVSAPVNNPLCHHKQTKYVMSTLIIIAPMIRAY